MKNKREDGWWETTIEILESILFSQMEPRSVEYIVGELQKILKDDDLENIIVRIKSSVEEETEDNIGAIANIIYNTISPEELTLLRDKMVKNMNFCDYIRDLVFELSD